MNQSSNSMNYWHTLLQQICPLPTALANGLTWYAERQERYRRNRIQILLLAESPPYPADGKPRYFYDLGEHSLRYDYLCRGITEALYPEIWSRDLRVKWSSLHKQAALETLCEEGYFLIDTVKHPICGDIKKLKSQYDLLLRAATPELFRRCMSNSLVPSKGVIIRHKGIFQTVRVPLADAGIRILHTEPLPFPTRATRGGETNIDDLVTKFRQTIRKAQS
jgi:hypothetical protein